MRPASNRTRPGLLAVLALLGSAWLSTPARAETIERIEVQGLTRMNPGAFMIALGLKEGDAYDLPTIRDRFKHLWKGGWFDDITFEAETTPSGNKILIIKVRERPTLAAVTYE